MMPGGANSRDTNTESGLNSVWRGGSYYPNLLALSKENIQ